MKRIYVGILLIATLAACSSGDDIISDNPSGVTTDTTNVPISFGTQLTTAGTTSTRATAATAYGGEWRPTKSLYGKTRKHPDGGRSICTYGDTIINNETLIAYALDSCRQSANTAGATTDFCGVRLSKYIEIRAAGTGKYTNRSSFNLLKKRDSSKAPILIVPKKNVTLTALYRRQTYSTSDAEFAYAQNDLKDLKVRDITDSLQNISTTSFTYTDSEGKQQGLKDTLNMDGAMMYTPGTDLNRAGADIYAFAIKTYNLKKGRTYVMYGTRTTIRLYGLEWSVGQGSNFLPNGTQAGVFGYHTSSSGWTSSSSADFMYNQPMDVETPSTRTITTTTDGTSTTTTITSNGLNYTPIRYWPNDDTKVSFWAYFPWNATVASNDLDSDNGININTTSIGNGKGMGSIKFTMKEDSREQVDFMMSGLIADQKKADHRPSSDADAPTPVSLTFNHMLSQIRIYINQKLTSGTTKSWDMASLKTTVELANIGTTATLTPAYADGKTTWTWSTPSDEDKGSALIQDYDYTDIVFENGKLQDNGDEPNYATGFAPGNILNVIPQTIKGGTSETSPYIKVTFTDKNENTATLTAYLADATWLRNHIYTYVITATLHPDEEEHEYGLKGGVLWYADHQTETGFGVGGDETYDDDTPVGIKRRGGW